MILVSISFVLAVLSACSSSKAAQEAAAKTELELSETKAKLDSLAAEVNLLSDRFMDVEARPNYGYASFDPSSKGYQRVDTTAGTFLVILRDITPYADGHRAVFNIGNPSGAQFLGFKLTVEWGPAWDSKTVRYLDWRASLRKKEFSYTSSLYPGRWNRVQVVLSPSKPQEVGYITVAIETDRISLY